MVLEIVAEVHEWFLERLEDFKRLTGWLMFHAASAIILPGLTVAVLHYLLGVDMLIGYALYTAVAALVTYAGVARLRVTRVDKALTVAAAALLPAWNYIHAVFHPPPLPPKYIVDSVASFMLLEFDKGLAAALYAGREYAPLDILASLTLIPVIVEAYRLMWIYDFVSTLRPPGLTRLALMTVMAVLVGWYAVIVIAAIVSLSLMNAMTTAGVASTYIRELAAAEALMDDGEKHEESVSLEER